MHHNFSFSGCTTKGTKKFPEGNRALIQLFRKDLQSIFIEVQHSMDLKI